MKLVKVFAVIAVVLAIGAGIGWQVWLKDQVAYAKVATAYRAKMVCSCRFVAGREMDSCMQDFTVDISAVTVSEEEDTITASVLGGAIKSRAAFEDGLGCALVHD